MLRSSGPTPSNADKNTAKHVIAAAKDRRALQRPKVANFFNHANRRAVTPCIAANTTRINRVDISANGAYFDFGGGFVQRIGEWHQQRLFLLDQFERRPSRGTWTKTRQFRKHLNQTIDLPPRSRGRRMIIHGIIPLNPIAAQMAAKKGTSVPQAALDHR